MTSNVLYNGNLNTTCLHLESGNAIQTAAPRDNNGDGSAFSPTDLLATSLAACMLSVMGMYAKNNNINLIGSLAEVTKVMSAAPRCVAEIAISIKMKHDNIDEKTKQILQNIAHTCPVARSLHPNIIQKIDFIW